MFSPDGTLISASAAPHCGDTEQHGAAWVKVIIQFGVVGVSNNNVPVVSNTEQHGTAWVKVIIQFGDGGIGSK